MTTIQQCESCGYPIGSGRLSCQNCGAASSIPTRVTQEWEDDIDMKDVMNLELIYLIFKRLKNISQSVSNLIIVNVSIELHFIDIRELVRHSFIIRCGYRDALYPPADVLYIDQIRNHSEKKPYITEVDNFYRVVCHHTEGNKIALFEISKDFLNRIKGLIEKWKIETALEREIEEEEAQRRTAFHAAESRRRRQESLEKREALLQEALAKYDRLSWWEKRKTRRPTISDMDLEG